MRDASQPPKVNWPSDLSLHESAQQPNPMSCIADKVADALFSLEEARQMAEDVGLACNPIIHMSVTCAYMDIEHVLKLLAH